jgi:hypothetical protein
MKLITISFATLLLLSTVAPAQEGISEYGKPDELKGVTRIFIFTGSDTYSREQIIKEIDHRQKKGNIQDLKIVDRAEDAEILLSFSEKGESYVRGVTTTPNAGYPGSTSTAQYGYSRTGVGMVLKPLTNDKGMRLLMSVTAEKWRRGQDGPATKFALAFIKAYMAANGETKK